jgi:hypothetical protein
MTYLSEKLSLTLDILATIVEMTDNQRKQRISDMDLSALRSVLRSLYMPDGNHKDTPDSIKDKYLQRYYRPRRREPSFDEVSEILRKAGEQWDTENSNG